MTATPTQITETTNEQENLLVPCATDEDMNYAEGLSEEAKPLLRIIDSVGRTVEKAGMTLDTAYLHAQTARDLELGEEEIRAMTIIRTALKMAGRTLEEAFEATAHTYRTYEQRNVNGGV